MEFTQGFAPLEDAQVHEEAQRRRADGWRYVQMLAVNRDEGVDVIYSYMKDGALENLVVEAVPHDGKLESISDVYLESFVCENEIHDLFGIGFSGLAIDFLGNFYRLSTEKPMTIISPEQLARREKEAKAKAAAAAKAAAQTQEQNAEDMEAKLAAMDPEKAAKVRAAMEAKAAKEKKQAEADLEAKLAGMDPEKAAKVRAAMEAKAAKAEKEVR
ncbi:NADH-quinone oxidoreductase subunit C [Adlercreutzia murintestinalis]|uniref:NADH-quinone oxidoreductase subunit C n=1 Tax=Adlercreutzia murintestinalis TaxID=2941325 RepID=UPI00203BEF6A|nr:NADH-quinone oxidoreductase subunit C [Adlercreutzia murintestinalis]